MSASIQVNASLLRMTVVWLSGHDTQCECHAMLLNDNCYCNNDNNSLAFNMSSGLILVSNLMQDIKDLKLFFVERQRCDSNTCDMVTSIQGIYQIKIQGIIIITIYSLDCYRHNSLINTSHLQVARFKFLFLPKPKTCSLVIRPHQNNITCLSSKVFKKLGREGGF